MGAVMQMRSEDVSESGDRLLGTWCAMLLATLGALLALGCSDGQRRPGEIVLLEDLDDSKQVVDRRICLVGRDRFSARDAEMLVSRLRLFVADVRGKHVLGRLTLLPCDAVSREQPYLSATHSRAQVLVLGDSAEARLRLGNELRIVRLSGGSDLGRLGMDGYSFELYSFIMIANHYPQFKGSKLTPSLTLEMRTGQLPPALVGTDLLKKCELYFKNLKVSMTIKGGFMSFPSEPLDDLGFRPHEGTGEPFLQCGGHHCVEASDLNHE